MNNLTVLIDGGFLLMKCSSVLQKGFAITNSKAQKDRTAKEFKDLLARTIIKTLHQFPADNVILMSEGGSWRKKLPVPKQLEDITYKGHRERKVEIDWDAIYTAYNEFEQTFASYGLTRSQNIMIEGDDWAWWWSRRLNAEGTNVLIWTVDKDLQQLVQWHNNTFTAWYNDRAGLILPEELECETDDITEFMLNPPPGNQMLDKLISTQHQPIKYINPEMIVVEKVLCGDAGDNIMSVVRLEKNGRTYRFSEKLCKELCNELNINSIQEMLDKRKQIAKYIVSLPKFAEGNFNEKDVVEMIVYNTRLVWLHERTLPDTVTKLMVQEEYKIADIQPLKTNHKLILDQDKSIEDTFYSMFD